MPDWRNPSFDWDPWEDGNGDKLINRHDVYPGEAEQVFYNNPDIRRSGENAEKEPRYIILGQTNEGRYLLLVCVLRREQVRIYSGREMDDDERHRYRTRRR